MVVGALCLMVFAVALVYLPGIEDYILLPKLLAFHLCLAVCCIGWLAQTGWGRRVRLISSPLNLPAFLLVVAALASAPSTTHPLDTGVVVLNQAAFIVLFFVAANAFSLAVLEPVLWASAAAGLIASAIGILQYHHLGFLGIPSNALPSATFGNRNLAAEYLICVIPLSGLLFVVAHRWIALILSGLSAAMMGVFLIYTRTRGAWVGAGGAILCAVVVLAFRPGLRRSLIEDVRHRMNRPKWMLFLGFLALFVFLSALPPGRSLDPVERSALRPLPESKSGIASTTASIFRKESLGEMGIALRLAYWTSTLRMVGDHPVLGVGPGGWIRSHPLYDGGATISTEGYHRHPHNDYLWIASEHGLIGLGIYVWFLVAGFRCLLATGRGRDAFHRIAALMFGVSVLSILGAACFGFPREQPQTALFPYLLFGIAAGATARSRTDVRSRAAGQWMLAAALVVSAGAAEMSRRRIQFDKYFLRAYAASEERWPKVLAEADRAVKFGPFRSDLLFFQGAALQRLRRYDEAGEAYRKALALAPHSWYVHEGMGFVRMQQGRLDEALGHCTTALCICPSASHIRGYMGAIYLRKEELGRAEEEFRTALGADPDQPEVRIFLGNLYQVMGKADSAVIQYQEALKIDPHLLSAQLNLATVYKEQGRFEEALPLYRDAVRAFSDNPEAHRGFGTVLEAMGHPAEAEEAYRKAIHLNPESALAYFAVGNLTFEQRRYEEALEAYRTFLKLWTGDPGYSRHAEERIVQCERRGQR